MSVEGTNWEVNILITFCYVKKSKVLTLRSYTSKGLKNNVYNNVLFHFVAC